ETADRIAVEPHGDECARTLGTQPPVVAALHDAKQRAPRRRTFERAPAALGPGQRQAHAAFDFVVLRRQFYAFVELHDDVGAEQELNLDGALRAELVRSAVEMRTERHALVADLA